MDCGPPLIHFRRLAKTFVVILVLLVISGLFGTAQAQDLEPRRWSHLPVGLNVLGVATGWTDGDILFDPVLRIEDATFDLFFTGVGYVRVFDVFGRTGRVDASLPYAMGRWQGLVDGEFTTVRRHGFADPRLRFSVNLYGAPPLKGKAFAAYKRENPVNTTVGAAVTVTMPFGEYSSERLINLGSNRWIVRPQLGVLHQRRNWQFEVTGSILFFETNHEFWQGSVREQDPLWFLQGHVIRSFKPGWWCSLSGGFAHGGQSRVNGDRKPDDSRARYLALSLGMPLGANQSLKVTYLTTDTHIDVGNNTNTLLLGWSVNWAR